MTKIDCCLYHETDGRCCADDEICPPVRVGGYASVQQHIQERAAETRKLLLLVIVGMIGLYAALMSAEAYYKDLDLRRQEPLATERMNHAKF